MEPVSGIFKGAADLEFMFPLPLRGCVGTDSWHSSCEVSRVTAWAGPMSLTHPGPKSHTLQSGCRYFPQWINYRYSCKSCHDKCFYWLLCEAVSALFICDLVNKESYVFPKLVAGVWHCLTHWRENKDNIVAPKEPFAKIWVPPFPFIVLR